jgi:flagellar biosynthesis protein FlhB
MERTEWPTRARLDELREQGLAAYSATSVRSLAALAVLLGLILAAPKGQVVILDYKQLLGASKDASLETMLSPLSQIAPLFFAPLIGAAVAACLAGLVQTRFMFHLASLSFNLSKLDCFGLYSFRAGASRLIKAVLIAVIFLGAALFWLWYLCPLTLNLLNIKAGQLNAFSQGFFRAVLAAALPTLALVAVLSWLVNWIAFMLRHRMTRQEVESEARD